MGGKGSESVEVDVEILDEAPSGLAWRVSDSQADCWIPKSQIIESEDELEVGVETTITIPLWLAEQEGFQT